MKLYALLLLVLSLVLMASKCKDKKKSEDQSAAIDKKYLATETKEQVQPPTDQEWLESAKAVFKKIQVDSPSARILVPGPRSLYASLERTPCFGRCPMYKLSFFTEGVVVYQVRRFVAGHDPGFYKGILEAGTRDKIIAMARELDYFSLNKEYPDPSIMVTDLPSTITYLKTGTQEKLINNKNYNTPENLKAYERFIDSLVLKRDWTRIQLAREK